MAHCSAVNCSSSACFTLTISVIEEVLVSAVKPLPRFCTVVTVLSKGVIISTFRDVTINPLANARATTKLPTNITDVVLCEYRKRMFIIGRNVEVVQQNANYTATVLGIDDTGALLVRMKNEQPKAIRSGEVRPI